jgi:hypothetical protein
LASAPRLIQCQHAPLRLSANGCAQIERFACLYTSHVSNLSYVSPDKKWQGRLDFMAHEDLCIADLL